MFGVGGAGGGDRDAGGADGPGEGQLPVEVFDAAGGARRVRARAGGRPQPRGVRRGVGPDGGGAVLRVRQEWGGRGGGAGDRGLRQVRAGRRRLRHERRLRQHCHFAVQVHGLVQSLGCKYRWVEYCFFYELGSQLVTNRIRHLACKRCIPFIRYILLMGLKK